MIGTKALHKLKYGELITQWPSQKTKDWINYICSHTKQTVIQGPLRAGWSLGGRHHYCDVIMARWRLKSPASRLFTQPSIQAQIEESIKAPRHWPSCREFTGPVTRKMRQSLHICWFNFDALAQGNAYKPTKEPINYRGPGGDRTHDLQTEATPPAASCPARTLHATEIAPKKRNSNDVPVAALDNWQPVWNAHGVNFNTCVC